MSANSKRLLIIVSFFLCSLVFTAWFCLAAQQPNESTAPGSSVKIKVNVNAVLVPVVVRDSHGRAIGNLKKKIFRSSTGTSSKSFPDSRFRGAQALKVNQKLPNSRKPYLVSLPPMGLLRKQPCQIVPSFFYSTICISTQALCYELKTWR